MVWFGPVILLATGGSFGLGAQHALPGPHFLKLTHAYAAYAFVDSKSLSEKFITFCEMCFDVISHHFESNTLSF